MEAALVGYGYWGQVLLPILKSFENTLDYSLSFVCDRNQNHSAILKNKYPAIKVYSDFDDLLSEEDIELIFITTRVDTHYELARKSLQKGCHTFIEKPFVTNVNHADELTEIAISKSLKLMVGHRLLYSPSVQWIKNNIFKNNVPNGTVFEAAWKQWGIHQQMGVHWDLSCHYIAVLNYLIDSIPYKVKVNQMNGSSTGNPENINIILEYPYDVLAKIDVSWNNPYKQKELIVKTTDRLIHINHESNYPLIIYKAKAISKLVNGNETYNSSFNIQQKFDSTLMKEMQTIEYQINDFLTSIRKDGEILASAEIATGVVRTLCMIENEISKNSN